MVTASYRYIWIFISFLEVSGPIPRISLSASITMIVRRPLLWLLTTRPGWTSRMPRYRSSMTCHWSPLLNIGAFGLWQFIYRTIKSYIVGAFPSTYLPLGMAYRTPCVIFRRGKPSYASWASHPFQKKTFCLYLQHLNRHLLQVGSGLRSGRSNTSLFPHLKGVLLPDNWPEGTIYTRWSYLLLFMAAWHLPLTRFPKFLTLSHTMILSTTSSSVLVFTSDLFLPEDGGDLSCQFLEVSMPLSSAQGLDTGFLNGFCPSGFFIFTSFFFSGPFLNCCKLTI